jgi:hypothetical protein
MSKTFENYEHSPLRRGRCEETELLRKRCGSVQSILQIHISVLHWT